MDVTIDETEVTRIRFEDLSESLQALINDLTSYDDEDYVNLRQSLSEVADSINVSTSVYAGDNTPKSISLGKTVYFNTVEDNVQISDSSGNWLYLN